MKKTIQFEGWMKEFTGYDEVVIYAKTVAKAVQILEANFNGISRKISEGYFRITADNKILQQDDTTLNLKEKVINFCPLDTAEVLKLHPNIEGAGSTKAWANIIIGAILVVASYYVPYIGPLMFGVGMSMIFTGISMLISPSTNVDKGGSKDDNKSFMFGGATNSIEQGGVIPVVFGKFGVGSTVISSALEAVGV